MRHTSYLLRSCQVFTSPSTGQIAIHYNSTESIVFAKRNSTRCTKGEETFRVAMEPESLLKNISYSIYSLLSKDQVNKIEIRNV